MIADIIAFFVYAYAGATLEHLSYFIMGKTYYYRLSNPITTAFPIYSLSAFLVIFINDYLDTYALKNNKNSISSIITKILVFGFVLTLLEYVTGLLVGAGKTANVDCRITGWNYSDEKYNIDGIISLNHFIIWGFLGLAVTYIHPKLMNFINCGLNCVNN